MPVDLADVVPGLTRWVTLPVEGMAFPAQCCRCGVSTKAWKVFKGGSKPTLLHVVGLLGGVERCLTTTVPFCESCQSRQRRGKLLRVLIGATIGGALGLGGVMTYPFSDLDGATLFALPVITVIVSAVVVAYLFYARAAQYEPVRLRNYSERDGVVQAWFENPEFRASVVEMNQDGGDTDTPIEQ